MDYEVYLSEQAIQQMQETVNYISRVLLSPSTATHWVDLLQQEIASLCTMPYRFPLVDNFAKHKELRKMSYKNFNVYYYVKEPKRQVWVVAIIYARRDQLSALQNID